MPYEYFRIQAGPATEAGIDGGIGAIKDAPLSGGTPMTQMTIPVENLEKVLAVVVAAGGAIVEPKMPIPGVGWYATCAEPGGLKFGLIQADPSATEPSAACSVKHHTAVTRRMICMASAARRRLLLLLGLLPLPGRRALGQSTAKSIRIGVLLSGTEPQWSRYDAAVVAGLREYGYVEGQNLTVVRRYGNLEGNRIKGFAAELNTLQLDAIVTSCTGTTRAAQLAAPDTPIVMGIVADPVGHGLVKSLARPGVNVTGRTSQSTELLPKRLELLRAVLPERATVAVLMNGTNPLHETQWKAIVATASSMNVTPVQVATQGKMGIDAGIDAALAALANAGAHGVLVLSDDPMLIEFQPRILAAVERLRLPAIYAYPEVAVAGGLMSYGTNMVDNFRRSATHVVKVAYGTKAAELPVEQSLQQEFVLNVRTAKALGLTFPRTLLARADRVIE